MKMSASSSRLDDYDIGEEWTYEYKFNDEVLGWKAESFTLSVGQKLSFWAKITEDDDRPDVGAASKTYTVTEEDIIEGFVVNMDLYVTENGERIAGKQLILLYLLDLYHN